MIISTEQLLHEAESTGFRPDILEKVAHLLNLLNAIQSHPYLKKKLVLKGGTALNLFIFNIPRLSIDIDLNYVGNVERDSMIEERPNLEKALYAVFSREGFSVRRIPHEHAGGKWSLQYLSTDGRTANLEVDINFMFRLPLWHIRNRDSRQVGAWKAAAIPVMDIHELMAGKISALLSRNQARDMFDCQQFLILKDFDKDSLRLAFIVYGAMNRRDWREVSNKDTEFDPAATLAQLMPLLRSTSKQEHGFLSEYGMTLMEGCRKVLDMLLPFNPNEKEFLDLLLDRGEVDPTLLTNDPVLQDRIRRQPLLEWKAINVRRYRGLA